jgi:two-component system sensor histidine kinase/response regulator
MFFLCILLALAVLVTLLTVGLAARQWRQKKQLHVYSREMETLLGLQEKKVKQLTQFAQQMQESEAGTRAIIEYALDGIITIDHVGSIIEFNPAAERLFGYESEEVLGKPIVELLVPEHLRESQQRGWNQFLATGYGPWIGQRVETTALHADGRLFPIELAITVLHPQQPPLLTAFVRDLSLLKQTSEKLAQSNVRLQAVLDAATQAAIIAVDVEGRIVLFNRGAERMLGFKAEEVVGKHSPELFMVASELSAHARRLTEEFGTFFSGFNAFIERARREGHEEREWTFIRKDGSSLTVNIAVTVLRDDRVEISGFLAVATDVTARRRAALALEQAKEAAESANRAKSDFLANMSHEIRTPMNGILGMTHLALDTNLNPEQREYLELIKTSADGLLNVINDILDFSKIEAGKMELDPVAFELRDTLADAMRSLSLRAHAKHLELAYHVPADVPDYFVGDSGRLRQVLLNLVANAIKFTERGEVVVLVSMNEGAPVVLRPGGDIELHFSVSDTGIGIPSEKLPYIFDPFVQADTSTTRKYGGTGLGLTIAGRLVEMMGGRLWAESVPGKGSTFHFTARLKLQDRSPSRLLPRRPRDLQGMKALVVDDNATNRRILEDLLASWSMETATAEGMESALLELESAAAAGRPCPLVLLDAHMPEHDGFALAAAITSRPQFAQPVLIMLTSANNPGDIEKCQYLGISRRLTKPIKPSDLLDSLLRALDERDRKAADNSPTQLIAQQPSSGEIVTIEQREVKPVEGMSKGLRVLLAEDNFINQRLVLAMLEKMNYEITAVGTGTAAVRAVQQESFDVVLMDVQMPEMNGLDATRAIRTWELQRGAHIPIIAMTAHAMKGTHEDCLCAGMDAFLSKPVRPQELIDILGKIAANKTEDRATFDLSSLRQRISDDDDLLYELTRMFQEECPRLLKAIQDALEAGDAAAVERTAHLLKGSASNFAAHEIVRAAQQLEDLAREYRLDEMVYVSQTLERAGHRCCEEMAEWLSVRSA